MNTNPLADDLDHILDHTSHLWDEMRGEHLFITGGTGFFGCWLLESFLWANDNLNLNGRVTVLTRSPDLFFDKVPHLAGHKAVTVLHGDIRSFQFPTGSFGHVIHAATGASAKLNIENPLLMLDTIIEGTRYTLDFAQHCNAKKFLLTSSGAVYGKQPVDMTRVPEDYLGAPDPLDPRSAYGQGKRIAEHLCTICSDSSFETKIARCFAFVGPYLPLDIHFAIGNFIRDALKGGPIIIKGDGTSKRSYLYAADLAIWLWTILFTGKSLRPYNVGSEESHSIAEVAYCVADHFSPKITVEIRGKANAEKPVEYYVPNVGRAKQELGLKSVVSLEDSISRTVQFEKRKYASSF
jgi:dTDP-glucose 4,6-dehydratase